MKGICLSFLMLMSACSSTKKEDKAQRQEEKKIDLTGVWKINPYPDSCSVVGSYRNGETKTGFVRGPCNQIQGIQTPIPPNLVSTKHNGNYLEVDHEGKLRRIPLNMETFTGLATEPLETRQPVEVAPGCFYTFRRWNSIAAQDSDTMDYVIAVSGSFDVSDDNPDACKAYMRGLGEAIRTEIARPEYMSLYNSGAFELTRIEDWWIGWFFFIFKAQKIAD